MAREQSRPASRGISAGCALALFLAAAPGLLGGGGDTDSPYNTPNNGGGGGGTGLATDNGGSSDLADAGASASALIRVAIDGPFQVRPIPGSWPTLVIPGAHLAKARQDLDGAVGGEAADHEVLVALPAGARARVDAAGDGALRLHARSLAVSTGHELVLAPSDRAGRHMLHLFAVDAAGSPAHLASLPVAEQQGVDLSGLHAALATRQELAGHRVEIVLARLLPGPRDSTVQRVEARASFDVGGGDAGPIHLDLERR